jgi:hypothetical protein
VIDDDTGQPVVGAAVGFWAEVLDTSDRDGRYLIDVPSRALSDALVVAANGYERTFHFLPKVPTLDHNLRIAAVRRIAPGDTITITLYPGTGLCGFDLDMTCRLLRAGDNLRVELESDDGVARVGLSTVLDPYAFASTASIDVAAGQSFQVLTAGVAQAPLVVTLRARAYP